ncbi:hypothetical protein PENSPDRAFT_756117 [Peniophora sp. CONT]|nr:hypothetical protein PENSPDRAFT_756117 [Peniophora sp. CONT]
MTASKPTDESSWLLLVRSRFSDDALVNVSRRLHLQTLDAEYASIEQALVVARRIRNKKTGPCSLPPEVLGEIFKCLQTLCLHASYAGSAKLTFHPRWVTVTHVCTFWRDVALSSAVLWATPGIDVLCYPQYTRAIVSRSQKLPLHLDLSFPKAFHMIDENAGLKTWFESSRNRPYCERAGRLSLYGTIDMFEYVAARLPKTMEHLRQLDLTVYEPRPGGSPLPRAFGDFHNVKKLLLRDGRIPWKSPIFSHHLTHLQLSNDGEGPRDTYTKARRLFSCLVSLQSLVLENIIPLYTSQDGPDPSIKLPSTLRSLIVAIDKPSITTDGLNFMTHIRAPPLCSRLFSVEQVDGLFAGDPSSNVTLKEILSQLSYRSHALCQAPQLELGYNRLAIASALLSSSLAQLGSNRFSELASDGTVVGIFEVTDSEGEAEDRQHDFNGILDYISLKDLRAISLTSETIHALTKNGLWERLLRSNDVRRIAVQAQQEPIATHFSDLLAALCHRHSPPDTEGAHFLFPRLETLVLDLEDEYEEEATDLIVDIVDLLNARTDLGVPLQEIAVSREISDWEIWDTLRTAMTVTLLD